MQRENGLFLRDVHRPENSLMLFGVSLLAARAAETAQTVAMLAELLANPKAARAMGERGRSVFEKQQGATGRAIEAILATLQVGAKT